MRVLRAMLLLCLCLLGGCSLGFLRSTEPVATLSDLQPAVLPETSAPVPPVDLHALESLYREVLSVSSDPAMRLKVLYRLADVELLQAEAGLDRAPVQEVDALYRVAIDSYRELLKENPHGEHNDALLYQLSRAYEYTGESEAARDSLLQLQASYPTSSYRVEAEFRLAEYSFSDGSYRTAETYYGEVVAAGPVSPHYRNALYMQGWSRFKLGDYLGSIPAFLTTLDLLVPADMDMEALDGSAQELAQDCLRVLAVVFSYLDGAATIAAQVSPRDSYYYQSLLYSALADLYLKQERYRDSIETLRAFTLAEPMSAAAHRYQLRIIATAEQAGFRDQIVTEKQVYVAQYSRFAAYWQAATPAVREQIDAQLSLLIDELALWHHALAQAEPPESPESRRQYTLAAGYYELYIASFPASARAPWMGFLLAESLAESGELEAAVQRYEWVAYGYPAFERAADAAYAAIISYQKLLAQEFDSGLNARRIESQLSFAMVFVEDARAPAVLKDAADGLLEAGEYQLALIAAAALTGWRPAAAEELLLPASLVMAHALFELEDYPEAALEYRQALQRLPAKDARRPSTIERLAASVYREAEQLAAMGDPAAAADKFFEVIALAPEASFRVQAQYDAAVNYAEAGDYAEANRLLADFRSRYPAHELSADIGLLLIENFEAAQQWQLAAVELESLLAVEAEPARQQELLYLAASYYDRAGELDLAIKRYRDYAHRWQRPVATRMEAMRRLAELYQAANENDKRNYWLRKLIAAHGDAVSDQSERSLYLAAYAASELAQQATLAFQAIELQLPLQTSLQRKNKALKQALQEWQQVNSYAIARFASLASYQMAEIYRELAQALLDSERPAQLDALALEQYGFLLEEQACPFEEKAIAIHESNARRSWEGWYDEWVKASFTALHELVPGRYAKHEQTVAYSQEIF
jgi:TolA-binding protein